MTRNDALHLCQSWLPLWTGNQPERLADAYSEDVFYRDPARPEGIHKILRVDTDERKIGLSLKRAQWAAEAGATTDDSEPSRRRGGLDGGGALLGDNIISAIRQNEGEAPAEGEASPDRPRRDVSKELGEDKPQE